VSAAPVWGGEAGGPCSVHLEGVVARYGLRKAVGPVNAVLEGPGLYWIVGPNGSGKSTLLRTLAGLKRPSEGRVRWTAGGGALARGDLRRLAGLAAPEIQLYEDLSVRENLEFLGRLRGVADPAGAARGGLEQAGLEARGDERPHAFSSGLRQRIRLTAAWLAGPRLLLLDEPSSNLDEPGRDWLWAQVRERARRALCVVATNLLQEMGPAEPRLDLTPRRSA
jgi:ABC-type multidrug transport system ATPase subunit